MKKTIQVIIIGLTLGFISTAISAQSDFIRKGRVLIETGSSITNSLSNEGSGASVLFDGGTSVLELGVEGGYFIGENFALKTRLGILSAGGVSLTSFAGGVKYYIARVVPVELTLGSFSAEGIIGPLVTNASIGYGIRLADNINLEPSIGVLVIDAGASARIGLNFAMFL